MMQIDGDKTRSSSFRIYYGGSGCAIPFKWESAPGTPIDALSSSSSSSSASAAAIPQLTPPPSFHFSDTTANTDWRKSSNTRFRPSLLTYVLQKVKRSASGHVAPLHSLSSFSTSSSSSTVAGSGRRGGYFRVGWLCGAGSSSYSSPTSPLHSGGEYLSVRTASFGHGPSRPKVDKEVFRGCYGL